MKDERNRQNIGESKLPTRHIAHTQTPRRKQSPPLKAYSSARPSASRSKEAMTADTEERISTAEKDINQLFDDTSMLFSGMKQMQKQQNYLMQRDQNQARKEADKQAIITGWPVDAQEQDRDR